MKRRESEQFCAEEAQRRFELALRGSREVGHKSLSELKTGRQPPKHVPKAKAKRK